MPELPEVEFTAGQLRATVVGTTINNVAVFWERTIGHPGLDGFLRLITGQQIAGIRRRGKLLLIDLHHPSAQEKYLLTIHRRMTGNFLLLPPGWEIEMSLRERNPAAWYTKGPEFYWAGSLEQKKQVPPHLYSYCRVCFHLSDGHRLLYTDPRKFGRMELWPAEQEQQALAGLGPEPLSVEFTVAGLKEALADRKSTIKQTLLAQEIVAGIGNIYADEALFHASIHPSRPAATLTENEIAKLHEGIISVLTLGIEHGGTSFNDYRDLWGEAGQNYNHVLVYQQDGKACQRCGTTIERITIAQRSTHFCPVCQH